MVGLGPMPWILLGELFPGESRFDSTSKTNKPYLMTIQDLTQEMELLLHAVSELSFISEFNPA